jgi:hypothetical protein
MIMKEKLIVFGIGAVAAILVAQAMPSQAQSVGSAVAMSPGPDGGVYVATGSSVAFCNVSVGTLTCIRN